MFLHFYTTPLLPEKGRPKCTMWRNVYRQNKLKPFGKLGTQVDEIAITGQVVYIIELGPGEMQEETFC